ncbi:MAG: PASTA domain-containing protein [Synergistaceae bacterium]|nr:PASTA domain-containing protein [Synergistaceae bacterium]
MKKHCGGIVLTTLFIVSGIIFASGAIAVYTVFMKPEGRSEIPVLRGKSAVDAVAEAERLGLIVQMEQVVSTLQEGLVLAQSPEPGTELRRGQVVVLQVSKGGELHEVPDVKGMTITEAQTEIKAQGFTLGDVVKVRERNVKAGEVIAQSPSSPAKISSGRKIDLLVQDGADANGVITVPDVNRMTEKEARETLTAAGLKVQGVDRVYSPLLPEGLAIETRPGMGSTLRAGQGVILKLATQRRPAGFMDADSKSTSTANGTARRVTSSKTQDEKPSQSQAAKTHAKESQPANTAATPPKQAEEFTGDDYARQPAKASSQPAPQKAQTPAKTQQSASTQAASSGGSKTARIRYIVPPIARPMDLRIEVTDPNGRRTVMNRQVRSGESISANASYSQECLVTIYLGGESVWQERKN